VEGAQLWRAGRPWLAVTYALVTLVAALAAARLGIRLAPRLSGRPA
jgi:fluoride ion exporter CrcB/FEX